MENGLYYHMEARLRTSFYCTEDSNSKNSSMSLLCSLDHLKFVIFIAHMTALPSVLLFAFPFCRMVSSNNFDVISFLKTILSQFLRQRNRYNSYKCKFYAVYIIRNLKTPAINYSVVEKFDDCKL